LESDDARNGSPTNKVTLGSVKARVDTNNRGYKNSIGSIFQSPMTYVLKKGKVKSTYDYIVNNLVPYGEPLF
jgi:hypothetical protein